MAKPGALKFFLLVYLFIYLFIYWCVCVCVCVQNLEAVILALALLLWRCYFDAIILALLRMRGTVYIFRFVAHNLLVCLPDEGYDKVAETLRFLSQLVFIKRKDKLITHMSVRLHVYQFFHFNSENSL